MFLQQPQRLVDERLNADEQAEQHARFAVAHHEHAGQRRQHRRQRQPPDEEQRVHAAGQQHGEKADDGDHEDGGEVADLREDSAAGGRARVRARAVRVVDDERHARRPREQAERVDEHQREDEHDVVPEARLMADRLEGRVVGRRLHEVARQHEHASHDQRHERAGLERREEARQVIGVRDEKAHCDDADDEQQRFLQPASPFDEP